MSKFKEMKFWIGDDPKLSERVQKMLFEMGYEWFQGDVVRKEEALCLMTVMQEDTSSEGFIYWNDNELSFEENLGEEINIDWLRTPKERKIVTVGDQKYYEDELADALKGIKPIN